MEEIGNRRTFTSFHSWKNGEPPVYPQSSFQVGSAGFSCVLASQARPVVDAYDVIGLLNVLVTVCTTAPLIPQFSYRMNLISGEHIKVFGRSAVSKPRRIMLVPKLIHPS